MISAVVFSFIVLLFCCAIFCRLYDKDQYGEGTILMACVTAFMFVLFIISCLVACYSKLP